MVRMLIVALVATAIPLTGGSAQIPIDPNCPPNAWCHPNGEGMGGVNGFMDGMTGAADAVGKALNDYECTALDCLAVVLRDIMCAVDGREIARVACGGGGGSGGGTGGTEPDPDESEAPTSESSTATPPPGTVGLKLEGFPANRLRTQIERTRVGAALRLGGDDGTRFTLQGKYANRANRPNRFIAVVQVSPRDGGRPTQMAVMVDRGGTRVFHHSVFKSLSRR